MQPHSRGRKEPLRGKLRSLLTDAGSVVLGKPRRAFACEATNGVNTQELTVVLLACTFIEVCKKAQDGSQAVPKCPWTASVSTP